MPTALADALAGLATRLQQAGVPDPEVDAALLVGHVLGLGRGGVAAAVIRGDTLTDADAESLDVLTSRRAAREPLQHLTGTAPFRRFELRIGPGAFVPRPETEITAQLAIDALLAVPDPAPVAVDLGTGSGAIALALALEVPHARVIAVERSAAAHTWAARNLAAASNAELRLGDLADVVDDLQGTVSVVVSNPPYVPDAAVPRDPEVRLFDPAEALYGGPDGLDVVRTISRVALRLLRPGGALVLEHGELQGAAVRGILTDDGWRAAATHPDLTRRDRVTTALRPDAGAQAASHTEGSS